MAATRATLIVRWPKFAGETNTWVTAQIALATLLLNSGEFGTVAKYDSAVELLACHFMQMEKLAEQGAAGAVSSRGETVGKVDGSSRQEQLTFAVGAAGKTLAEDGLRMTSYGRMYLLLRNGSIHGVLQTGG